MTIPYEKIRDDATELAEIRVSALLQAFAMPHITQAQIRQLLVDAVSNSYTAGFASGWDDAVAGAEKAVSALERFRGMTR